MKHPYFKRYELLRKKFNPGTVWKTRAHNNVEELVIIDESKLPPDCSVYQFSSNRSNNIAFRVLKTKPNTVEYLSTGRIVRWTKDYMEQSYEVSIDV